MTKALPRKQRRQTSDSDIVSGWIWAKAPCNEDHAKRCSEDMLCGLPPPKGAEPGSCKNVSSRSSKNPYHAEAKVITVALLVLMWTVASSSSSNRRSNYIGLIPHIESIPEEGPQTNAYTHQGLWTKYSVEVLLAWITSGCLVRAQSQANLIVDIAGGRFLFLFLLGADLRLP